MAEHKSLTDLKQCMNKAKNDNDRTVCETTFKAAGGTVTATGGKVFSSQDGAQAFVSQGGKVFSAGV